MLSALSILFFIVLFLILYIKLLKNTVFGININNSNYAGSFLFLEIFIFLLLGVALLNIYPVETFFAVFKVEQDSVYWISLIILYSLFALVFSLWGLSFYFTNFLQINNNEKSFFKTSQEQTYVNIRLFTIFILFICLALMIVVLFMTGAKHAFIEAILTQNSLSAIRASNKAIGLARYINHLFIFIGPLISILIATPAYDNKKIARVILFLLSIFIGTYMGSKGPLMNIVLAFVFAYMTFHNIRLSMRKILYVPIFILFLFILIYAVVKLQYAEIDFSTFLNYLVNRLFIAQIDGVYEEFNLLLSDWAYWWHTIPFLSSFIEHPIFHKDLMMISEDRIDPSSIGIKNTLFIAESYALGNWFLVVISPFIYAFNLVLTYMWFNFLIDIVIENKIYTKYIVALFLFSYISISGGFSDILFFKLPIMMTIFLTFIIVPFKIWNMMSFKSSVRQRKVV